MATDPSKASKTSEKIIAEFQTLRNEQRNLANNLHTLESDLKEHKTVIDTLKTVEEDRKCFRLIGGVLCARTVKDVLPQLSKNKEHLEKLITIGTEQLTNKGVEINKFKEEHNIKIKGQETIVDKPDQSTGGGDDSKRNVLVA